jgi:hypothetical protein
MGATVASGGGSARITQRLLVTVILAVTVTGALAGCGAGVAGVRSDFAATSVPTSVPSPLDSPLPGSSAGTGKEAASAATDSLDGLDAALATIDGSVQQSQNDLANGDQSAAKNDNG